MNTDVLEAATLILTRAELFHDSVRNELFKVFRTKEHQRPLTSQLSRKAVYHLVMETARRQNLVDEYINFVNKEKKTKFDSFLVNLLRIATYILKEEFYSSGKSPTINEVIRLVKEVTNSQQSITTKDELIYCLQRIHNTKKEELLQNKTETECLALEYFHLPWFVDYLVLMLGKGTALQLMKANNEYKQVWLRINKLQEKRSVAEIIRELTRLGVITEPDRDFPDVLRVIKAKRSPVTTHLYRSKHIFAQDKTSSAISHILDPQPQELIVDLACAYGLKFVHITTLMKKTGRMIGIDVSSYRIRKMRRSFNWMLSENTHLICADSRYLPLKKHIANRILLDAPCSSSGIYHMYPDHKWRDRSIIDHFSQLQKELFLSSLDVLKSSGIGLYSVCSLFYEEGEQIIIENLDQIRLIPIDYGSPAYSISPERKKIDLPFCRRTFPHLEHTGSFFIAKFTAI